jgi:putative transposase
VLIQWRHQEVLLVDELFMLSEAQMRWIAAYVPLTHGIPRVDDRRVLNGIFWRLRTGVP